MPPAAVVQDHESSFPLCCGAFDIGEIEIEVQAIDDDTTKLKSTQIVVSPGSNIRIDENGKILAPRSSLSSNNDYMSDKGNDRIYLDRCLVDSFDSTDEIVEGSNEMKLMKRVVNKQRANSDNMKIEHNGLGGKRQHQRFGQQDAGFHRQDSMSDTNSVNSNDVFVAIEDSKEMEYLDVLDQHLNQTNSEAMNLSYLEDEIEGSHPNRQIYQANLDDIIEHLCAAPCGQCLSDIDTITDDQNSSGRYPKSVLRIPKYSSPDKFSYISMKQGIKVGTHGERLLIRSSSDYNAIITNSTVQEQHSVHFQNVDIRNFKMTLGNHPSATTGPPVMLDGELIEPHHLARKIMTLEKYEQTRPPRRKRRQLKLTLQQRHNILVKERGFSFEEVKGAWQEALQIRKQRKETLDRGLAMMKWDEVWESTCRKFNRLVDVGL
mmetsp:Transcript_17873/g.41218  ORF Transcript_17873/g.41218 Transcript_17873/m.41218 type:complete len:433 (+) Transcript_17873:203-1501(+)|eukprot:CAMPEP_0197192562 /NCGR_PEP_ID=MMETSP1423-20130617/25225_1 /TAXON_ID=476441 /ORGANISM="Pseudo-nitzschia heimii, Strain UNC1101" /LENGTH=432 /DNA_ID=CAMNT_0042645469 /DNA_START=160 /DNA_END=1458 /DNA_ORIENTATION=+